MAKQQSNIIDQIGKNAVPLMMLAGAGIVIFKVVLPLINSVSSSKGSLNPFADSEQDVKDKNNIQELQNQNYFDPSYYQNLMKNNVVLILTPSGINKYAKIIHDAKGYFNDDESAVYGVFRALKTKTQISSLSKGFFDLYKTDLFGYLQNFLNLNEMGIVAEICNKLPIGITDNSGNIIK